MSLSRRQFITRLGVLAAASALPPAFAEGIRPLYPPTDLTYFARPLSHGPHALQIGCAAITWNGKDLDAIRDISALGYPGIQLRANALTEYPDPHALRDLLAKHSLIFVALSSNGGAPLDPRQQPEALAKHLKNARYLREVGGKYLQIMAAFQKGTFTAADYKREGQFFNEIGKRVADYGIQTGFHNHMDTIGQTPQQVAWLLEDSDPRYVKLELDTAHYAQGGGNPVDAIRKYHDRLLFLHLKDVKPAPTKSGYEFTELGQGTLDWPAILAALREVRFRGWGIVELDDERIGVTRTPKESAALSKQYLEKLGVTV